MTAVLAATVTAVLTAEKASLYLGKNKIDHLTNFEFEESMWIKMSLKSSDSLLIDHIYIS